jgi:hypothetical protein
LQQAGAGGALKKQVTDKTKTNSAALSRRFSVAPMMDGGIAANFP